MSQSFAARRRATGSIRAITSRSPRASRLAPPRHRRRLPLASARAGAAFADATSADAYYPEWVYVIVGLRRGRARVGAFRCVRPCRALSRVTPRRRPIALEYDRPIVHLDVVRSDASGVGQDADATHERVSETGDVRAASAAPIESVIADLVFVPVFETMTAAEDLAGARRGDRRRDRARARVGRVPREAYESFVTPSRRRLEGAARRARRRRPARASRRRAHAARRGRRAATSRARIARSPRVGWSCATRRDAARVAQAAADGLSAAEFDVGAYKKSRATDRAGERSTVIASGRGRAAIGGGRARAAASSAAPANFARDARQRAGQRATPREFADARRGRARSRGPAVEVLDEERIRAI